MKKVLSFCFIWFRGFLTVILLSILSSVILLPFGSANGGFINLPYWILPEIIVAWPFLYLNDKLSFNGSVLSVLVVILSFIFYLLIGFIIGLLVDKINFKKVKKSFYFGSLLVIIITIAIGVLVFLNFSSYISQGMTNGFNIKNHKVYVYQSRGWAYACSRCDYSPKILKNVDFNSFVVLNKYYAKDRYHVYYFLANSVNLDFKPEEFIINGADPKTFEIIDSSYSKDKNHVYIFNRILENADPKTFEVIPGTNRSKDKNYYFKGDQIDSSVLID